MCSIALTFLVFKRDNLLVLLMYKTSNEIECKINQMLVHDNKRTKLK